MRGKLDWSAANELARRIDEQEIDVIVCTNGYPLLYALLASRRARRQVRLVEVFHTTGLRQPLVSRLRMLLNRFIFRRCELVIYVSHKQREYWRARGLRAKRDTVIQNGIDADYFTDRYTPQQKAATRAEFGFAPSDFVVGICAALRAEKAHGDLLRALRRLRDAGVPAKVLIIGDGSAARRDRAPDRRIGVDRPCRHCRSSQRRAALHRVLRRDDAHLARRRNLLHRRARVDGPGQADGPHAHRRRGRAGPARHQRLPFEPATWRRSRTLRRLTAATDRLSMGAVAARDVRERFTIQRMVERFTGELQQLTERRVPLGR